jgi:hypothetical protein
MKLKWTRCSICGKFIHRTKIRDHMRGTITVDGKRICPFTRQCPDRSRVLTEWQKRKALEARLAIEEIEKAE